MLGGPVAGRVGLALTFYTCFCICIRQCFQVIVEVHPADAESTLMSIRAVREAGPAGAPGALRIDFICDPML